jgi:hypothetical protein
MAKSARTHTEYPCVKTFPEIDLLPRDTHTPKIFPDYSPKKEIIYFINTHTQPASAGTYRDSCLLR